MCCFFRTAVTSFCVKSHSRNSHLCVEELVRSRPPPLCLTRNHVDSSGTWKIQTNPPGNAGRVRAGFQSIIAGCHSSGSSSNVWGQFCVKLFCCLSSCYKVGRAARGDELLFLFYFFRPHCTSTQRWKLVYDRSQVSVCSFFFFFF